MRITAEYISDQKRLLVRLLGTSGSPVQIGPYSIDGRPQLPKVQDVEVMSGSVVSDEVDLYFAGYYPFPTQVKVTLPDLSVLTTKVTDFININNVYKHSDDILMAQPSDALTPDEPPLHFVGESPTVAREVEVIDRPQVPSFWVSLNFEQSNPVVTGAGLTPPLLHYTGGGTGRALDSSHRQPSADYAPWLLRAPLRLEGAFTNLLAQSTFYPVRSVVGMFDQVPTGWDVVPTDSASLVRVESDSGGIDVPSMTLSYTPRTNGVPTPIALTVFTPPIPANTWFQIIVAPGEGNDVGSIQMTTADGLVISPVYSLSSPVIARFNVGTHAGRVKILWSQQTDGQPQTIRLYGPICSNYGTSHSWIPPLEASGADNVLASGLGSAGKWSFHQGSIRIESAVEDRLKPFSWNLKAGSQSLLKLDSGVLSSDFSASTVDITPYLSTVVGMAGVYNLVWSSPTVFSIQATVGNQLVSTPIPFAFGTIPDPVLLNQIDVELKSFSPTEGSAIVKLFKFSPT